MKPDRSNLSIRRWKSAVVALAQFIHQGVTECAQDPGYLVGFCLLVGVVVFSYLR